MFNCVLAVSTNCFFFFFFAVVGCRANEDTLCYYGNKGSSEPIHLEAGLFNPSVSALCSDATAVCSVTPTVCNTDHFHSFSTRLVGVSHSELTGSDG